MSSFQTRSLELDHGLDLSVVVAVAKDQEAAEVLQSYRPVLDGLGMSYEVLCMTNAKAASARAALVELAETWPNMEVVVRDPWAGEDGELGMAYKRARGETILTIPTWPEVAPEEIEGLFRALEGNDMAICRRSVQPVRRVYQKLLTASFRRFFGYPLGDVFCRTRLSRRAVLEEVGAFGVRQHFMPIIASQRGYRVTETPVRSARLTGSRRQFVFRPLGHLWALFDAATLFVVLKFLHRPLRFFGAIGLPVFLCGFVLTAVLGIGRLFMGVALADRPLLILSTLMLVLGIQIIALGLIGEIIIFANSRRMKHYAVAEMLRDGSEATVARDETTFEKTNE